MIVPVYCLDTSCILEGWRRHYPPDVFEGFWRDLQRLIDEGVAISPDAVRKELLKQDDEVAIWAERQTTCFVPFDEVQEPHLIEVMTEHELLVKNTPKRNAADPFVIALAKTRGIMVVSEEQPGGARKPKIPDVCQAMKIKCISVVGLMRNEGWTY